MNLNVRDFLASLYTEPAEAAPRHSPERARHDDRGSRIDRPEPLSESWRELYEERAAIREYDGGQTRERAEASAFREILVKNTSGGYASLI